MTDHATIIRKLTHTFKTAVAANNADMGDVSTAVVMLLFELATTKAAISQATPNEELAKFIAIIEESFGEYLLEHAPHIKHLNALGDALMGRRP